MNPILSPEAILDQIRRLKTQRDTARAWAALFGLALFFLVAYLVIHGAS